MADGESPESPVPVLAPGTVIMVPKVKKQVRDVHVFTTR